MSSDDAPDSPAGDPGPDYRLLALAAIVPAIVIVAILVRILIDRPHDSTQASILTVVVPAQAPSTACGAADASTLARQGTAVEATVTEISGRIVRLQPKRVFKGEHYGTIQIDLPPGNPPAALQLPSFSDGTTYLLAVAPDGAIAGCGLTGKETSSLQSLYTSAFG